MKEIDIENGVNDTEVKDPETVTKKYTVVKPWDDAIVEEHAGKVGGRRLLKEITVTTDDDFQFVYLVKRPSRNVLMAISEKKKGNDIDTGAVAKLMMGLVLEGDMSTVENDGAVYSELMKQLGQLVKTASSEIKKI